MVQRVILGFICLCFPVGSILVKPLIIPEPIEPVTIEIPKSLNNEQAAEAVVSRLLREGISFAELDPEQGRLIDEVPVQVIEKSGSQSSVGAPDDLASQILASVRELDGFEDYQLPESGSLVGGGNRISRRMGTGGRVPRLYTSGNNSSFDSLASATSLGTNSARLSVGQRTSSDELTRSPRSGVPEARRSGGGGGIGGGAAASRAPIAPGIAFSPLSTSSGGNVSRSVPGALPSQNEIAAAISSSPLLATTGNFSTSSIGATVDASGRPVMRADGKYGIPNAQYWRFGFNHENDDGFFNQADATIYFENYLVELEGLLEGENQVVKYSPTELRSIYDDLNTEIDTRSDASPSYLTFMIIEFPIKGFHLAQEDIPGDNPNFGIH